MWEVACKYRGAFILWWVLFSDFLHLVQIWAWRVTYISVKSGVQLSESTVRGLSVVFSVCSPFSSSCPRDRSRLLYTYHTHTTQTYKCISLSKQRHKLKHRNVKCNFKCFCWFLCYCYVVPRVFCVIASWTTFPSLTGGKFIWTWTISFCLIFSCPTEGYVWVEVEVLIIRCLKGNILQ